MCELPSYNIQLMAELAHMEMPDLYANSNRSIGTFVEAIHFEFNSCAKFVHMDRLYTVYVIYMYIIRWATRVDELYFQVLDEPLLSSTHIGYTLHGLLCWIVQLP